MNNKDKIHVIAVVIYAVVMIIFTILGFYYHPFVACAQESISENTTEPVPDIEEPDTTDPSTDIEDHEPDTPETGSTDISQSIDVNVDSSDTDGRINALEIRMQEMGIYIDELRESLVLLETENAERQIELSEKLDLIVIALDDIINFDIQYLDMYEAQQAEHTDFNETLTTYLDQNSVAMQSISENTLAQADLSVSGNSLAVDLNEMIQTGNEENRKISEDNMATYVETSTEHTAYTLIFIGIAIGAVIGLILSVLIKRGS